MPDQAATARRLYDALASRDLKALHDRPRTEEVPQ
jgi:hypothetical protein